MPKATNALHSDQISAAQAGVAKSVVGRDIRAEERSGFYGCELIRYGSDAARFSDHHFRISSVRGYSQYHRVLTIHDVSASARFAYPIFSGNEADTNPLTDFPSGTLRCLRLQCGQPLHVQEHAAESDRGRFPSPWRHRCDRFQV